MKILGFIIILCISLTACTHLDVFEKTIVIPDQKWFYNNKPEFSFNITDTTISYNIFIVLRHTDAYEYNNMWVRLGSKAPGDSFHFQNLDLTLGTDAKGWEGVGMDDIFDVRKTLTPGPVAFKMKGTYTFTIAHIMRENPLKYILNVGIRVEKVRL